jgi:hypothetical protein
VTQERIAGGRSRTEFFRSTLGKRQLRLIVQSRPRISFLFANSHARPDPGVAVPIRLPRSPVAIAGRWPVVARLLRANDTADNTAEDGSTRVIAVVMMMVVVMVILGKLHANRPLLRASRIIGF